MSNNDDNVSNDKCRDSNDEDNGNCNKPMKIIIEMIIIILIIL